MTRRVVITGMGILSPLGRGLQTNWDKLTRGVSGISAIRAFDTENFTAKVAGQIPVGDNEGEFQPDSVLSPKEQRHVDPFILYGLSAATDAVEDSGYIPEIEEEMERAGVLIRSGILYSISLN